MVNPSNAGLRRSISSRSIGPHSTDKRIFFILIKEPINASIRTMARIYIIFVGRSNKFGKLACTTTTTWVGWVTHQNEGTEQRCEVRQAATPHPHRLVQVQRYEPLRTTWTMKLSRRGTGELDTVHALPRASSLHRVRGKRKRARNATRSRPTSLSITKPIAPTSGRGDPAETPGCPPARDFAGGACVSVCVCTQQNTSQRTAGVREEERRLRLPRVAWVPRTQPRGEPRRSMRRAVRDF